YSFRPMTDDRNELDAATSARLKQLGAMPIDTSHLDAAVRAAIPRSTSRLRRLIRPLTAAAASIAIVAAIIAAIMFATSGGEVLASPAQMAEVHRDIVANRTPVTHVSSIEEAGKVLSQSWSQSPALPQPPDAHVMACCMKSI